MIIAIKDFSLERTLSSGQIFSFFKKDEYWYSFTDKPIAIRQSQDKIELLGLSESEAKSLLGLNDKISEIKAEIDKDDFIDRAIAYSGSLRVVKSGLWPATLSFILSIQSNVNLILRRIQNMSEFYGISGEINGISLKSFPPFDEIYEKGYETLKKFKLGFRTKFVFSAASYFHSHELDESMGKEDLSRHLLDIDGVGEKVLDCIKLYGLHDLTSFPMDVWIFRILSLYYNHITGKYKSYKDKRKAIVDYFGQYAGYAELFIYDYSRLNSIK
jgi:N-glycosylase/DNA lyase